MRQDQFQDEIIPAPTAVTADDALERLRLDLTRRLGPLAANARLITDMPLTTGEVRLTLTSGPLRITAWGPEMAGAVKALISRMDSGKPPAGGKGGQETMLLPL